MAAQCGSSFVISFKNDAGSPAYTVCGGFRTQRLVINAEAVDVTNSSSTGRWRELLNDCGVRSATLTGEGIFVDDAANEAVRDAMFENELRDAKILVPSFGTFEGQFKVTSLEMSGEYNDAGMWSMTLESAGELTFTAA
jgi:TP901-1 family phage major tail protein